MQDVVRLPRLRASKRPQEHDLVEPAVMAQSLLPVMEAEYPRVWAANHLHNEDGESFRFKDRKWLADMWDDNFPRIDWMKSAQSGLSTLAYIRAIHSSIFKRKNIIYTMPTANDVGSFVTGRLDRIIDQSDYLKNRTGWKGKIKSARKPLPDSGEMKSFGGGIIYFKGTMTKHGALSVPAQALYHDEIDESNPEIIEMFAYRQNKLDLDPTDKEIYRFSTPTVTGFGIHAIYEESDMREWLVECGCGWQGPLDWWTHTREGKNNFLQCTECGGMLDPNEGEWVAEFPSRSHKSHGYHISRLMTATKSRKGEAILEEINDRMRTVKHKYLVLNMDLGLPSSEGSTRLTEEMLRKACFRMERYAMLLGIEPGVGGPYFMGVDQGDELQVTISTPYRMGDGSTGLKVVLFRRLSDSEKGMDAWVELEKLMRVFQVKVCVVDGMPNSAPAHEFARKFPGRVYCSYYTEGLKQEYRVHMNQENPLPTLNRNGMQQGNLARRKYDVTLDRTETLDVTYSCLSEGFFQFPEYPEHEEIRLVIRQCTNDVRKPAEDARTGTIVYRWWKGRNANDYWHSLNYNRVAFSIYKTVAQPQVGVRLSGSIVGATPNR